MRCFLESSLIRFYGRKTDLASIVSGFGHDPDDFGIEINFRKNTPAPARVFHAMSRYIESFEFIDAELLSSVNTRIRPLLLLEDIEAGSIRTWLKNSLESIDDEALKSGDYKKIIGAYLVKGKRLLVNFMDKNTTIEAAGQVSELQTQLLVAAEQSDVLRIATYHPVPVVTIAESLRSISEASKPLQSADSAKYLSQAGEATINISFSIAPNQISEILVREEHSSSSLMILKVKKPDFIGDSMWDFVYDGRTLSAKVLDDKWLKSFREGDVLLRPGDALRAMVHTRIRYGFDNEVISSQYDLLNVLEVLQKQNAPQLSLDHW